MLRSLVRKHRVKYSYKKVQPWAFKALERDLYICQDCKDPNKLNIVVHHIDESRKDGYRNMNNNIDNLVSLCKVCHAVRHGFVFKSPHLDIILELSAQGKSYGEIARYIGISRQRVHQIIKKPTQDIAP